MAFSLKDMSVLLCCPDIGGTQTWVQEVSAIGVEELGPKRGMSSSHERFVSGSPRRGLEGCYGIGSGLGPRLGLILDPDWENHLCTFPMVLLCS